MRRGDIFIAAELDISPPRRALQRRGGGWRVGRPAGGAEGQPHAWLRVS